MARVYNFNPGPAALPLTVLQKCQAELLEYPGAGMSILEMSHRSKEFEQILADTQSLLKKLMGLSDSYKIMFLGGGASLQFTMIPMNFIPPAGSADYLVTGEWAKRALKEANLVAKGRAAAGSEDKQFSYLPAPESFDLDPKAAYVHITSNNTIFGTQWQTYPTVNGKPLLVDMSSDILSRNTDFTRFAMIYAGAQKNLGPAGVTVVFLRDDFGDTANKNLPTMLSYETHRKNNSLYNTPPVFAIYTIKLMLEWIDAEGGVSGIETINRQKATLLYTTIDNSNGFYRGTVRTDCRSWMNAPLRMNSEELETEFLNAAKKEGLVGLKGHRSVGGIRVSLYNAVSLEAIKVLTDFMKQFQKKHE
jgi:phosphoserine aminotransferase